MCKNSKLVTVDLFIMVSIDFPFTERKITFLQDMIPSFFCSVVYIYENKLLCSFCSLIPSTHIFIRLNF